jgi:hypothetical protein
MRDPLVEAGAVREMVSFGTNNTLVGDTILHANQALHLSWRLRWGGWTE